jgi:hypothetical protein
MISYRYLPIFPQEAELNPITPEDAEGVQASGDSEPVLATAQA